MPSRFYLPSTGDADVSPAISAEWEAQSISGELRRAMVTTKIGSTATLVQIADATATSNRDILHRQYVSGPIGAQTITGTVKGQWRVRSGVATQNLRSQIIINVVSGDGATVRGTLYAGDLTTLTGNPANEWLGTGLRNSTIPQTPPATLTSVTAENGDRLVVELGSRKHVAGSVTSYAIFGDAAATDFSEDNTDTTVKNPWVEFSMTILPASSDTILEAEGLSTGISSTTGTSALAATAAGISTGISLVQGDVGANKLVAGATSGASATTGEMDQTATLAGSAQGTSIAGGQATTTQPAAGATTGTSAVEGDTSVSSTLAGASIGTSTAHGDISRTTEDGLSGSTTGTSLAVGSTTSAETLAGSSAGISTAAGDAGISYATQGATEGTSDTSGAINVVQGLSGTASGTSDTSGNVLLSGELIGYSIGSSDALELLVIMPGEGFGSVTRTPIVPITANRVQIVSVSATRTPILITATRTQEPMPVGATRTPIVAVRATRIQEE